MSYLLSIIIPTKNRYTYLKECLLTLKQFDCSEVEIVVQDNSDDNSEILEFVRENSFGSNLKYFYSNQELSQTGNSDLAVSHATGEYCCYIGDDDSLSLKTLEVVKYLKANDLKACVCNVATYHWPDVVFESKKKPSFSACTSKGKIVVLHSNKVLKKFFSWGAQDIKYLPRIYHGIISKSVLEQIKDKTGSFFPGPSPDMANAVSCALIIDKYIYIRAPLVLSGYSYKSAGGMGLRGQHKGELKDVKQLPKGAEKEWSLRIPKVWLGYTVWPESAEKALIHMDHQELIVRINYYAMEAKIYLRYKDYRKMIKERIKSPMHFIRFTFEALRFMFRWFLDRLRYHTRKLTNNQYIRLEKMSLAEAFEQTNNINNKVLEDFKNGNF